MSSSILVFLFGHFSAIILTGAEPSHVVEWRNTCGVTSLIRAAIGCPATRTPSRCCAAEGGVGYFIFAVSEARVRDVEGDLAGTAAFDELDDVVDVLMREHLDVGAGRHHAVPSGRAPKRFLQRPCSRDPDRDTRRLNRLTVDRRSLQHAGYG